MNINIVRRLRRSAFALAAPMMGGMLAAMLAPVAIPAAAQEMETIDPDAVIDADLLDNAGPVTGSAENGSGYAFEEATPRYQSEDARPALDLPPEDPALASAAGQQEAGQIAQPVATDTAAADTSTAQTTQQPSETFAQDDLIGAAEGLFGQGAEGLARLIEDILADQGEPNGYIVGREAGGAVVLGLRYGSGTLFHAVEGNMPVYWTGPSIGFDLGANAGNTFVLVYNLFDTNDLYERFPAGEGQAYFVGGFTASYVRRGDIVMIPIRVGAGLRLGVNAGYMRFSREQKWLPF